MSLNAFLIIIGISFFILNCSNQEQQTDSEVKQLVAKGPISKSEVKYFFKKMEEKRIGTMVFENLHPDAIEQGGFFAVFEGDPARVFPNYEISKRVIFSFPRQGSLARQVRVTVQIKTPGNVCWEPDQYIASGYIPIQCTFRACIAP